MESSGGSLVLRSMSHMGKEMLPPMNPFLCAPPSHVPSSLIGSSSKSKPMEGWSHHQRCSSESYLIEEQPSWLEDLLDDSEPLGCKCHRRSASDTSAYLDKTLDNFLSGSLWSLQNNSNPVDPDHGSFNTNPRSFGGITNKTLEPSSKLLNFTIGLPATNNGTNLQISGSNSAPQEDKGENHSQSGSVSQNPEGLGGKSNVSQNKTGAQKADAKRPKNSRQSAHRSRVRKLEYIAELERNVQVLQTESSGFAAEIEFLDQHNLIVSMENRALRQRVESLSQELLIKHLEHDMLEREVGRLQSLFQLQMQQLQYQHQQQQHHHHHKQQQSKNRQNIKDLESQIQFAKAMDMESQFGTLSINHHA